MTKSRATALHYALLFCLLALATRSLFAADATRSLEGVSVSISARTGEQMEAFYSARGFPPAALKTFRQACFFTVGIRNASDGVVWLELQNFLVTDEAGKKIARITRPQWKKRLTKLRVPLASQSTFGWTQLPEQRDLQPDEPVGGNFSIPRQSTALTLAMQLRREDKSPLKFEFPGLRCAE